MVITTDLSVHPYFSNECCPAGSENILLENDYGHGLCLVCVGEHLSLPAAPTYVRL